MKERPFAPQYVGDGVYAFLAKGGTAFAYVEWEPAEARFMLSERGTKKPLGWVTPPLFNQRVIGYMAA